MTLRIRSRLGLLAGGLMLASVPVASALPADGGEWFSEVALAAGLDFVHFNGMSGRLYYPEVVGSGGALLDYDGDGDLDLFLVQGTMLGADRSLDDALLPAPGDPDDPLRLADRLYRNDLEIESDGSRRLRFVDVTAASGIRSFGYGMGAAVGDIDNDGDPDLYVTNLGDNQLWRNNGDGSFSDATAETGTAGEDWSVSASFADYDDDGRLDLYVTSYLDYSFIIHKTCLTERGESDYCLPSAYRPAPDVLYRNLGDGRFEDVSERAGLHSSYGNGLGVVAAELNGDGRLDFYVANDLNANQLWINRGDGTFVDDGLAAGCALNREGVAEASMGVAVGDADRDGDLDLFMTHFRRETNTLYRNQGGGFFRDSSHELGLATPSWNYTAFGTGFLDYDADGLLDLFVANGAVTFPPGIDRARHPFPLAERNQLFRAQPEGGFIEVSALAGPALALEAVSRGALLGDLDNDGDTDLVVTNNSGRVHLLLNRLGQDRPWVGLELVRAEATTGGNGGAADEAVRPYRHETGAVVRLELAGGEVLVRRAGSDGSYASAGDPRVLVNLPAGGKVARLEVDWPGGLRESFALPELGRYTTLRRGAGRRLE